MRLRSIRFRTHGTAPDFPEWAERGKARVDQAIAARDEDAGAEAHAALTDAEHRARMVETARRCARKAGG